VSLRASSGGNLTTIDSFDICSSSPTALSFPCSSLLMFTEAIFLRRLIRSLEDRHSMVPGRLLQLGFQTFLQKRKSSLLVFDQENPRNPKRVLGTKIQHSGSDVHSFSSSGHF
jgi:hypothetical protein